MDVLNRLIPRSGAGNGGGFKRLKHSSQLGTQSADDFFAIGGPSNGLDHPMGECDQFALIPATNSPKIELGLVPKKQEEKPKSEIGQQKGKMPWKNGKEKKKAEKEPKKGQKGQNGQREKSCEPNILPQNRPSEGGNGTRRCRTLLGSILPGSKKEEKRNGGRLNPSMSEPQLNFMGDGNGGGQLEEHQIWDWEGQHQVNGHGDRHRLYEEELRERMQGLGGGNGKKGANKKLAPMAGAFQKVREKLPGKLGANAAINNNSPGIPRELSSSANSANSSSSSPSSTSSSRSSIGRSKTTANGFAQNNGEGGRGTANAPTLTKLRKHAKIMDIVGKKEKGGDFDGNKGANNQQSRKPIDAQHLLLFEESLAMD